MSQILSWPLFAGLVLLAIGLWTVRSELSALRGLAKLIALGPVLTAAPLAVFGAEHLVEARSVMNIVPEWMPARLFWTYLVGFALIAAALSFVLSRYVRLSATLLGIMFLSFVAMIHLPNAFKSPGDRILWAVAVRDTAFAGGALAFAGTFGSNYLIPVGRVLNGIAAVFFGVEHFLHPEFAPGVPLAMQTPSWVPIRELWGYLAGAVLIASGSFTLRSAQWAPSAAARQVSGARYQR